MLYKKTELLVSVNCLQTRWPGLKAELMLPVPKVVTQEVKLTIFKPHKGRIYVGEIEVYASEGNGH